MDASLASLERKVEQIIALCETLRVENRQLRARVGALENENHTLMERMTTARVRLEGLMGKLPPEA